MKKLSKLICVILSICILCLALSACSADETESVETEIQSVSDVSSDESTDDESKKTESTTTDETQLTVVETEFGEFYYPTEYYDYLSVEEEDNNAVFTAELDGETYTIFTLSFGEGEGNSVGTIVDSDGNEKDVFVELFSFDDFELSDSDLDILYAMQEGVNTIIENLD